MSKDEAKDAISVFTFSNMSNENFGMSLDYRCMFIPADDKLINNLLTVNGLKTIEDETERLERIANFFNPKIATLDTQYNKSLKAYNKVYEDLIIITEKIEGYRKDINDATDQKEEERLRKKLFEEEIHFAKKDFELNIKDAKRREDLEELNKYRESKRMALSKIDDIDKETNGVFFNLQIAEEVSAGNYIKGLNQAKLKPITPGKEGKENLPMHNFDKPKEVKYAAFIKDDTTDNFGNPLVPGKKYMPVVLTYSTAAEEILSQFTNAMSNYKGGDDAKVIIKVKS